MARLDPAQAQFTLALLFTNRPLRLWIGDWSGFGRQIGFVESIAGFDGRTTLTDAIVVLLLLEAALGLGAGLFHALHFFLALLESCCHTGLQEIKGGRGAGRDVPG